MEMEYIQDIMLTIILPKKKIHIVCTWNAKVMYTKSRLAIE